jgi:hypothetical protein
MSGMLGPRQSGTAAVSLLSIAHILFRLPLLLRRF